MRPQTPDTLDIMTKVQRSADRRTSPRNAAAEDVIIKLLSGNANSLVHHLTKDAGLEIIGKRTAQGREPTRDPIGSDLERAKTLSTDHALTHGKVGAVNGSLMTKSGSEQGPMLTFATTQAERIRLIKLYSL